MNGSTCWVGFLVKIQVNQDPSPPTTSSVTPSSRSRRKPASYEARNVEKSTSGWETARRYEAQRWGGVPPPQNTKHICIFCFAFYVFNLGIGNCRFQPIFGLETAVSNFPFPLLGVERTFPTCWQHVEHTSALKWTEIGAQSRK